MYDIDNTLNVTKCIKNEFGGHFEQKMIILGLHSPPCINQYRYHGNTTIYFPKTNMNNYVLNIIQVRMWHSNTEGN